MLSPSVTLEISSEGNDGRIFSGLELSRLTTESDKM